MKKAPFTWRELNWIALICYNLGVMDANRGEYGPPVLRQDLTLKNSVEFLTSDLTLCMSRLLEAGFNLLKDAHSVILVNPEHARALRGRNTDVKDAEWLADLLRHDLRRVAIVDAPS